MEDEQQHGIVDKCFFTKEPVFYNDYIFQWGFVGWVECQVGSNSFLIHTCKEKSIQHILDVDFFKESHAQFFDDLDELKVALKQFRKVNQ